MIPKAFLKERPMRKVAVTGLGVICPLGGDVETTWQAMEQGKIGVERLQRIDPSPYRVKIGGEIKDRSKIDAFEKAHPGRYERSAVLSILASQEAVEKGGLVPADLGRLRVGSFFGTTMGEVQLAEQLSAEHFQNPSADPSPASFNKVQGSHIAFAVLDQLGLSGPALVFSNACASGNYAIGWGFDQIRQGRLDAALCGGVDAFSRVAF